MQLTYYVVMLRLNDGTWRPSRRGFWNRTMALSHVRAIRYDIARGINVAPPAAIVRVDIKYRG